VINVQRAGYLKKVSKCADFKLSHHRLEDTVCHGRGEVPAIR
jgi:hypothetical protein